MSLVQHTSLQRVWADNQYKIHSFDFNRRHFASGFFYVIGNFVPIT